MDTVTSEAVDMSSLVAIESPGQGSWLKVAALMGCKPEMAVFRKFRTLNVLRLLEMQSELADQEQEYRNFHLLDTEVECSITKSYAKDWDALNASQGKRGSLQRDAWRKIKERLEAYSKRKYLL
ncbi:MAG: hypothetical protein Q9195_007944 [Heterodermia aff. obscurata]